MIFFLIFISFEIKDFKIDSLKEKYNVESVVSLCFIFEYLSINEVIFVLNLFWWTAGQGPPHCFSIPPCFEQV